MEPVLDELSLTPSDEMSASLRVRTLAETLRALDKLGAPRLLRSVRDAVDRDLGDGRGLREWCFDRATDRDAGRLLAQRLASQPFVDGEEGLFAAAEGAGLVEARVEGQTALGAGLVALNDGVLVLLWGATWRPQRPIQVDLLKVDPDDEESKERHSVLSVETPNDVTDAENELRDQLYRSVKSGAALLQRAEELLPRVRFGPDAIDHLKSFTGSEPFFRQIVRHLRTLDLTVAHWKESTPFKPIGITFSVESKATLDHGTYGEMRYFSVPKRKNSKSVSSEHTPKDSAEHALKEQWSLHTKMTGGDGARMYYRFVTGVDNGVPWAEVQIGYIGPHLKTVRFS
jgi:hypothetical protein